MFVPVNARVIVLVELGCVPRKTLLADEHPVQVNPALLLTVMLVPLLGTIETGAETVSVFVVIAPDMPQPIPAVPPLPMVTPAHVVVPNVIVLVPVAVVFAVKLAPVHPVQVPPVMLSTVELVPFMVMDGDVQVIVPALTTKVFSVKV